MTETGVEAEARGRRERVAVGVVVACLTYGGSLALQARVPAVKDLLAVELAPNIRPTYYARVATSLICGALAFAVARTGRRSPCAGSERIAAWSTALFVAIAAMVAIVFP